MKDINKSLKVFKQAMEKFNERRIITYLSNPTMGKSMEDWEVANEGDFAEVDPNGTWYYYEGPLDDKTRPFCQEMLLLGKFFSQTDLDMLSAGIGYNVYLYEGRWNCRHRWVRARIKQKIKEGYVPDEPTNGEINRLRNIQDESGLTE